MSLTPKAGTLAGFNLSGLLGDQDASALANNTGLFDSGPLSVPPFASGLALQQSAGGPFTPLTPGSVDLWLRADLNNITFGAGSNVQKWNDLGPRNLSPLQFTGLNQPVWNGSFWGPGVPAVRFAASSSLGTAGVGLTPSDAREIFVVCNSTNDAVSAILTERLTTLWGSHTWPGGTGFAGLCWTDGVNAGSNATVAPMAINQNKILNWSEQAAGVALTFWANGTPFTVTQTSGMTSQTGNAGLTIGFGSTGLGGFIGVIAEIICYYRQLTVGERSQVTSYLKTRYSIP